MRVAALLLLLAAVALGERPNVVVILADDLGYADLGVQGSRDVVTPRIDALARGGVRCTNAYVTCPVCAPTRAGLLTGRYQQRFGLELNPGPARAAAPDYGLPADVPTIAARLKAAGYVTGMVGKWHLGYREGARPGDRGFDEWIGFLGGARSYYPGEARESPLLRGTGPVAETKYLTTLFGEEAAAFVARHRAQPFFLYLAFNAVHAPLEATAAELDRHADVADRRRRIYVSMLASMDAAVGLVLDRLKELGLEERTLVFFLSDNGGPTRQTTASNAPLRGFKGQVYEGGVRVPLLVRWPARLPAGRVHDRPVVSLDIAATALAAAGLEPAAGLEGVDLVPFLQGKARGAAHDLLCWRFGTQSAARLGDWKLVVRPGRTELFDLATDPGEAHDLAGERTDKLAELWAAYARWNADNVAPRWQRGGRRRRPR